MYSTASRTLLIFSASSSGISMPNSSSKAITSSTISRESAPRSSVKLASSVTSSSSTPNCSTMMLLTRSATAIVSLLLLRSRAGRARTAVLTQRRILVQTDDSSDVQAAGYVQHVPGDVPGLFAGQVKHGPGHVVDGPEPLQRDRAGQVLARRLGQIGGHGSFYVSRGHSVDRDAPAPQLPRQRLGQADQPRLGRGIVRLAGVAHQA